MSPLIMKTLVLSADDPTSTTTGCDNWEMITNKALYSGPTLHEAPATRTLLTPNPFEVLTWTLRRESSLFGIPPELRLPFHCMHFSLGSPGAFTSQNEADVFYFSRKEPWPCQRSPMHRA